MLDSEFVKKCRQELGFSQNELAYLLDKNPRTIRKWESQENDIQRTDMMALAFLVQCKIENPGDHNKDILLHEINIIGLFTSVEGHLKKIPA